MEVVRMHDKKLDKAIKLLKSKCEVIPEKYCIYNGAHIFLAYPPNTTNKESLLSPLYLVDVSKNLAGPFSPAFDLDGFFKATENLKSL